MLPAPPAQQSWHEQFLVLLRRAWWPLLAVTFLTQLATALISTLLHIVLIRLWLTGEGPWPLQDSLLVVGVLIAVPEALGAAWWWSASVLVLRGQAEGHPVRLATALGLGLRQSGRLGLWLSGTALLAAVAIELPLLAAGPGSLTGMIGYMFLTMFNAYLLFATALLPLVVLVERGSLGRALRLVHGRLATALQVGAVLASGFLVDLHALVPPSSGFWSPAVFTTLVRAVAGVPVAVLTLLALTVIYLRRVSPMEGAQAPSPSLS